jgi:hypothetical protein
VVVVTPGLVTLGTLRPRFGGSSSASAPTGAVMGALLGGRVGSGSRTGSCGHGGGGGGGGGSGGSFHGVTLCDAKRMWLALSGCRPRSAQPSSSTSAISTAAQAACKHVCAARLLQ